MDYYNPNVPSETHECIPVDSTGTDMNGNKPIGACD